jgi:transposase
VGRPKLDPAMTQRIIDLIRAGNYLEVAATAAGIHRSTLYRWMRHGRDQKRGRYRKFLSQVEKAQAEAEARDVAIIAKAAPDDWRAAAWRLERKAPRRYGPRVQLAVQQELEAVLGRLEKGLPPETYEKVLQIMTAEDNDPPAPAGTLERLPP